MKRGTLAEVFSCLLAGLFIYASLSKLLGYGQFRLQLSKSPFITNLADYIVWFIPSIEIITALSLAIPALRLAGLYASLFLLTLFTVYLLAMLNFSYYIPCSCGGILSSLSWRQHIVFNIGFMIVSLVGIMLQTKSNKRGLV